MQLRHNFDLPIKATTNQLTTVSRLNGHANEALKIHGNELLTHPDPVVVASKANTEALNRILPVVHLLAERAGILDVEV